MPQAMIGQKVAVDMSGLQAPGVFLWDGVQITGTIAGIDVMARRITVQLDASLGGQSVVTVPPEQIKAIS